MTDTGMVAGRTLTDWISLGVLASAVLRHAGVAVPVADEDTEGAFLGPWRLMSIDGFEWDVPNTEENAAEFGYAGTAGDAGDGAGFPKARVATIGECASHAEVLAAIGPVMSTGSGSSRWPARCTRGWRRTGC